MHAQREELVDRRKGIGCIHDEPGDEE
jgi:hypothetical protein